MDNQKMEAMVETKLLDYNMDKSCFMIIGDKKACQEMEKQMEKFPLGLCGSKLKQETKSKYLGDQSCCLGLTESVALTVRKRKGLVTKSIYEIRAVVEDCRSQVVGGWAVN